MIFVIPVPGVLSNFALQQNMYEKHFGTYGFFSNS